MRIVLENLGKRFNRQLIFDNLNYTFKTGYTYALTGANGSGKSTLIQILSGSILPSEGKVEYLKEDRALDQDEWFQHISLAAPYMELIEEFTLKELLHFHFKFKPVLEGHCVNSILEIGYLTQDKDKFVKNFSSGMKQRLKLLIAFFSKTPILLLDEPTSNMDERGQRWYQELLKKYSNDRLMIIASNQKEEYGSAEVIRLSDYK